MSIKEDKEISFTEKKDMTKEIKVENSKKNVSFFRKIVFFVKAKLPFFVDPYYGVDDENDDIKAPLEYRHNEEKIFYISNKDQYKDRETSFFDEERFLAGEKKELKSYNGGNIDRLRNFVEETIEEKFIQDNFADEFDDDFNKNLTKFENEKFILNKEIKNDSVSDGVQSKSDKIFTETHQLFPVNLYTEEERYPNTQFLEEDNSIFLVKNNNLKESHGVNNKFSSNGERVGYISYEILKSKVRKLTFKEMNNYLLNLDLIFNLEMKKEIGFINSDGFYTNLAFLFSEQCDHSIRANIYVGTNKNQLKDKKEFKGSLLKQYFEVTNYINSINCGKIVFKDIESHIKRDYEPEKIRESLLNAIVHRDYNKKVSTIINIYEDKMEFMSYGKPTDGFDENLLNLGLIPNYRNSGLVKIFEKLNLINSCGSGISKILRDIEFIDKTVVKVTEDGFYVSLNNRNYQKPEIVSKIKNRRIRRLIKRDLTQNNVAIAELKREIVEKTVLGIFYQNVIPEVVEVVPQIKYFTYQIDKIYNNNEVEEQNEESYVGRNQQRLPFSKTEQLNLENLSKTGSHERGNQDKANKDILDINRQYEKILKFARKKEYITRKDIEKKLKLKQSRVLYILKDMTEKGLLIKNGVGKSTYYKAIEE